MAAVVFRNEENGYTVLRLDAGERGEVTVVGCMPGVAPGEGLAVHGSWSRHSAYGEQFKAEVTERRMPVGEKAVFDFLASGAVRGVGASTARRMLKEFGTDVLTVLEDAPERLTCMKGMTRKRALAIGESFRLQLGMRRLMDFLTSNGLPLRLAMPLYRRFGSRALEALKENPYLLLEGEEPMAFSEADGLALSLGMEEDSPRRVEAGLLFELVHNVNNGHTFLPRKKLLKAASQLLDLEGENLFGSGLEALLVRGEVVQEEIAGETACYLRCLYECECYVAHRLAEMSGTEFLPPHGIGGLIESIEHEQGIVYAPRQREAVEMAACRQVMLLTGGPGMGKTTSLRGVLALLEQMGLQTALAAPTGRAAKRLGEACGMEASTIHRLLETRFDPVTGQLVFAHDEDDPLKADAVIVDETSMVDLVLMRALLAALRGDCRLILVGDPDQLPSVGAGNVLSDLLRSGAVPTVRLTEIFRQAAESAIIWNAHMVNQGSLPNLSNSQGDFFFLRRNDPVRAAETIVELCSTRLPKMGIPADQIQVLSPTRKYLNGTAALNRALQEAVNPPAEEKGERRFGHVVFREGDRVMQVKNNYDIMWQEKSTLHAGLGMFNGDIGTIAGIDRREDTVTVDFDGRIAEYTSEMLGELEPAYAITVHKAQGSEYRAVIFAATEAAPMLLTRGVLYTAITRARELFIMVGDEGVVARMAANNRQKRRYSALRARLI